MKNSGRGHDAMKDNNVRTGHDVIQDGDEREDVSAAVQWRSAMRGWGHSVMGDNDVIGNRRQIKECDMMAERSTIGDTNVIGGGRQTSTAADVNNAMDGRKNERERMRTCIIKIS
ncbi:hypothetical protein HN873_039722 [Arachis hypogaea]